MFPFSKKHDGPLHKIDEAEREEILKLLAEIEQSKKSKYPRLALILKMGTGYVAMAVFTIAALTFSALSLYGIYNTARDIVYIELPAMNSLSKLRTSLLAQENFAGKYAILKDPTFIDLFHQREKEAVANLTVLEKTAALDDVEVLKRQYQDYQQASAELFSNKSGNAVALRPLAVKLLGTIDAISEKRQDLLQGVLSRADYLRQATVRWTIIISCTGFVLAIVVAILISYRIFSALKRLQTATGHLAAGDLHFEPVTQVGSELLGIAGDFAKIAERLKALEELKTGTPQTVSPELEELKTGTPQLASPESKLPEKTEPP